MIRAGATVGFVGLGKMGTPMATPGHGGKDADHTEIARWLEG